MNMEDSIEMTPKVLLIGHLYLSKKSKNTFKESKLKKLCTVEVDPFCKNYQKSTMPKIANFAKWA